jgi:glycosyltransferase involved in cell wall biosynthesis
LLIARLIRDKGIVEYVEAARIVKRRHPEAVFRLVGPFYPNPTALSKEEVEGWQREGLIEYCGETEDVRPHIARASVYVLPSYREGTPRSILEAMSMGRAIITTDVPGCRETVVDGENGILVPPYDAEKLAQAMECFIWDPERIASMGRESRRIAEEKFDVHRVNAVILKAMGLSDEKTI